MREEKRETIKLIKFPLIFPKLIAYLTSKGISIRVEGKMGSDFRINEVVMKSLLSPEWVTFPDIAYYDTIQQCWCEHSFENTEAIINLGRQGEIIYSKQMFNLQDERGLSALCDYLRLNSSGGIVINAG